MNNIIKDCGGIWNRLFDHRPCLSGEILYFQEEFETKRNEDEIKRLFEVLELVTETRDSQIDKLQNLSETNLPSYQTKLNTALSKCKDILENNDKYNIDSSLSLKREIRKSEWERFQTEIKAKYLNIDEQFDAKEKDLLEFYTDLEKKLHIGDSQL